MSRLYAGGRRAGTPVTRDNGLGSVAGVPELPEVEAYRQLAERALGRRIARVRAPDDWYLKRGLDRTTLAGALRRRSFTAARRIGKLLLLDTVGGRSEGPTLGLRFGMTGRLLVDGRAGVGQLLYSSSREDERWDRVVVEFGDGGDLRVRDPRRLGGVELDPDESRLGPDAASLTLGQLREALGRSVAPLKARLMDQSKLAGAGNLITDEALWRAGLAPTRPAGSLSGAELRRLHRGVRGAIDDLVARGGSHTGHLLPERRPGGRCPRDGEELERGTVGGRTTWWCPKHQL
jgi:formamidopyrimidine-DNA glycosylase